MITIDKLVEIADRIMDVGSPTDSSISTPINGGDFDKSCGKRSPQHCEIREGHVPDFLLSEME